MRTLFKRRRRVNGKIVESKKWTGRYRLKGDAKYTEVFLDTSDKQVASKRFDAIILKEERRRIGLVPSEAEEQAIQRPLSELVRDFVADRERSGRTPDHVRQLKGKLHRLMKECGWRCAVDISAQSFSEWRIAQTNLTPKTINEYQDAASGFTNWLVKHRRMLPENPFRFVERLSTVGRNRFERRALSIEEVERLLAVAGPRKEAYQVAIYLALRKKEISLLQWRDVDLEREKPCVTLRASTTKNRKGKVLRLHPVAASALAKIRDRQPRTEPTDCVFEGLIPSPAELRKDLLEAGIPFDLARRVDFHSLRHTADTMVVSIPGIAPRTAMEIMRHGSMELTMNRYTDATLLPTEQAILSLPWLGASPEDGHTKDTQQGTQLSDVSGRTVSQTDAGSENVDAPERLINKGSGRFLARLVALCREIGDGARCRVRTCRDSLEHQGLTQDDTPIGTPGADSFAELALVVAVWPHLPEALRAAVMAIVRTHGEDLSINGRTAEVAAAQAPQGKSLGAGVPPELPVCGQVAPATNLTASAVARAKHKKPNKRKPRK